MTHTTSTHNLTPLHDILTSITKGLPDGSTLSSKGISRKKSHAGTTSRPAAPTPSSMTVPTTHQETTSPQETCPEYALFIAIDWADQGHEVCVLDPTTQTRTHDDLEQSPQALHAWLQDIQRRHPGQTIAVAVEQKTGAVINFLLEFDWIDVYPINPVTLSKYRSAFHVSGVKDDPKDADLILDLLTLHRDKLRRLRSDDALTRTLQRLVRKRRDAVNQRTRFNNQLKDLLKQYYPLFLTVCGDDLYAPLACDLLLKYPGFDDVKQADPTHLRTFYCQHGGWKPDIIAQRLALIQNAQPLTTDPAIIQPAILEATMLASFLIAVGKSIITYDKTIADLFSRHEDAPIFESFPGAGPGLAPRLQAAFGTNRHRFDTATEVQNTMGISPVKQESGTRHFIRWRPVCSKFLRQRFHEYANQSIKQSVWAKAYYQQQRDNGKSHHTAIRALAFKWIRMMFRCWKTRQPYNEVRYLKALQRRHAPLLAYISKSEEVVGH